MALHDPIVSKLSVSENQEKLYSIIVNLTIPDNEDGWEGINQDFPFTCPLDADPAVKQAELIGKMQEVIDRYKHAKAVYKSNQLTNALAAVQAALSI